MVHACKPTSARLRPALRIALALVGALAASGAAPAQEEGELWTRGRLNLRYDYRTATAHAASDREDDQDLTQDLFVEAGYGRLVRAEASLRVREDIDGRPEASLYRDLHDTYGDRAVAYLYSAYVELLEVGPLARLRLGRQYYAEEVGLRFDGALLETAPLAEAISFAVYGGQPVHLYEASRRGDWMVGAAAVLSLIPRTRIRFDYVHVTDVRDDLEDAERRDGFERAHRRDDDLFQLTITHRLTEALRLRAKASTFEGRSSRVELEALYLARELDLTARLRYVLQMGAFRDLSVQFTPLDEVLGEYHPYSEVFLDVRKGVGEHLQLGAGAALRELAHDHDKGRFNHEYRRLFVYFELFDLPWQGLSIAPQADAYLTDANRRILQVSGSISQELGPVTISGGSSFARYQFDEELLEERERVRTYFGEVVWRPLEWLRTTLRYSFEDDDEDEYHALRFDVRFTF